jgi:SSS family solute:Na+ symporter
MSDPFIIAAVAFGYLALVLAVGIAGRQKAVDNSLDTYMAGGRSLGFMLLFFIIGAEFYSSVTFLGAPGWAYSRGVPALYLLVSFSLALIPWWWLGTRTARLGRHYGFLTQGDLLGARFESRALSTIVSIIGVMALLPYLVTQIVGSGYLFSAATGGKVPFWLGAFLAFVVVLAYTLASGLRGIGWTTVIQGSIMLVAASTVGLLIPFKFYGGVGEMFARIAAEAPQYLTIPGNDNAMPWGAFSSAIAVTVMGMTMWPHLFNRAYAATSDDALKRSIMMFPMYSLLILPVLLVGFAGILIVDSLESADQIMFELIAMAEISPWLIGLVLSGALAASMSTGANVLHTIASILVKDLYLKYANRPPDGKQQVKITRSAVVVVFAICYVLALNPPQSILSLVLVAFGALVQLLPGVLAAFVWPRATARSVISGLVVGVAITAYYTFLVQPPFGIHAGLLGFAVNGGLVLVTGALGKPGNETFARQFMRHANAA